MKKSLLIIGLAFAASSAFAHIGWTYKQCVQQYGKPFNHTVRYGLNFYDFSAHGVLIAEAFDDGYVVSVSYFALQSALDVKLAMKLIDKAAPNLTWDNATEVNNTAEWRGYYHGQYAVYAQASVYQGSKGPGVKIQVTRAEYGGRFDSIEGDLADQL